MALCCVLQPKNIKTSRCK